MALPQIGKRMMNTETISGSVTFTLYLSYCIDFSTHKLLLRGNVTSYCTLQTLTVFSPRKFGREAS